MKNSISIAKRVANYQLFQGISEELILHIVKQSEIKELEKGEVLIQYGVKNNILYLLLSGELEVIIEKDGTKVTIPISPGESLGEMSLVIGSPTSAMALSNQASSVLAISEEIFWNELAVNRQGVKNMMSIMGERLHRNNYALIREIEEQLKYKQLEKDLETAGKIQSNIVPDGSNLFPNRSDIDVYALMKQAREVGGDFFDAMALDQDHIYFAIGDATGKGMPAALFMMQTFSSLRLLISNNPQFEQVVPELNNILLRNNEDMMFVSIFIGILNTKNGLFRYANGGHNPPFAALAGNEYQVLEVPKGPVVGVLEKAAFEIAELSMQPNDSIVMYTDGLPEANNSNNVAFEMDRIQKAINILGQPTMKDLVHALENTVDRFVDGASTHDDMTILAFRYLGG